MNNKTRVIRGLTPDLWPRSRFGTGAGGSVSGQGVPSQIDRGVPSVPILGDAIYIGRGFQGRAVNILTTPVLIEASEQARTFILLNPSSSIGLVSFGTISSGTTIIAGNTQATPIGVANYLNMHFFLNVTAITATVTFIQQAYDPVSATWADVQNIFTGIIATGTYYAAVATLGSVSDMAVRWTIDAPGSITYTLGYVLKEGIGGTSGGLTQTVYLGSNGGVTTVSGFPLLEGQRLPVVLGEGVELWGVAGITVGIRIFQLQP